jgi:hypothetical protein
MLVEAENVERVKTLFKDSSVIIEKLGDLLAELFEGFLIVLNAASPQAERFLNFLIDKMTEFNEYLKTIDLEGFFARSGDIAADFGEIFGNVFDVIGAVIQANFGPDSGGQYLLDWLKEATGEWAKLNDTVEGKESLKTYFKDVAVNAKIILQTIGKFLSAFSGIGADPALGETFKILQEAAPYLEDILKASVGAGPAFAKFIVQIFRFIRALTDSEAPRIFFDTLSGLLTKLNDFLETEFGQSFLRFTGKILAFTIAIGTAFKFVAFFFKVLIGNVRAVLKPLDKVFRFVSKKLPGGTWAEKLGGIFKNMGKFVKIGGILTVVVALVMRFIELVNTSKEFRDMLGSLGKVIGDAFGRMGEALGKLWDSLMTLFGVGTGEGGGDGGFMGILNGILDFLLYYLVPAISMMVTTLANALTFVINLVTTIISAVAAPINQFFQGILELFSGRFAQGFTRIFGSIVIMLLSLIQIVVNAIIDLLNFLGQQFTDVLKSFGSIPFLNDILQGMGIDLGELKFEALGKVTWAEDASANLDRQVSQMAYGGTVYPRSGGTLVNVAEAGRAERIEPLDANGLSQRDKELMKVAASGSGVTINMTVNAPPNMDVKELTSEVSRRIAFGLRKGAISI